MSTSCLSPLTMEKLALAIEVLPGHHDAVEELVETWPVRNNETKSGGKQPSVRRGLGYAAGQRRRAESCAAVGAATASGPGRA